MKKDIIPDILNSRNETVILELPNYSYCHSSQTQAKNHSFFLGRYSLLNKLENLLSSSTNKTGIYLVTGNRGVGKSRLVEKAIEKTSLGRSHFFNYIIFLFVAFFLTLGLQYVAERVSLPNKLIILELILLVILSFVLGHKSYVRETAKCYDERRRKFGIYLEGGLRTLRAAAMDFFLFPDKANPFLRTRNILKLVLILLFVQITSEISGRLTQFQCFTVYLCVVLGYSYVKYAKRILIEEYRKSYDNRLPEWEFLNKRISLAQAFSKSHEFRWSGVVVILFFFTAILGILSSKWFLLFLLSAPVIIFVKHWYIIRETLINKEIGRSFKFAWQFFYPQINSFFFKIDHYIQNSSRVYLRINFGHDILNEQDVLRLITRMLTLEYKKFRKSWLHTLYWRALALAILFSATYLFYENIYKNDFRPLISSLIIDNHRGFGSQECYFTDSKITLEKYIGNVTPSNQNEKNKDNIFDKTDKAINRIYCFVLNLPKYFWTKEIKDNKEYNYDHKPINYAFLSIFFFFYLLGCGLLRLSCFTTHYTIRRKLKHLNENITYSVEREFNVGAGGNNSDVKATFGFSKKKSRLIADAREIERELQDVLNAVQKVPAFMARPEFVIIFDELDKVNPEIQVPAQGSETKHKETLFATNTARERQAIILKLLSNMKYFLSTANAKFVFIAGREMYDMHLADIADRNNYFGSIFNDVIFVPSFLTDCRNNKKQYDITTLVEEYVCRHLIPENYPNLKYNLKEYVKYLDDKIYSSAEKSEDKKQAERKKQKIIATLQQFIIYLAHTSKGAPKKIVQVFESFIDAYQPERIKSKYLVVKHFKRTNLYLNFDYYDQYTIGMTSYLMTPVFNRLSDANIQEHSDKLLVSTLHFVDYLMKFHNQNFSWRSIDISPEIMEISHSPELKAIVNDIVTLFEQIHFHKPIISLYEFKFDALLAQEIFFLSRMDERFSAQFNFSLDESLILKEYYKKLLKEKQAEYKEHKSFGDNYVSSIASLQIVLGDLHFLDDELEVAALYYKDGLYLLRKQIDGDVPKEKLELFYLFLRNQLKLAYLYEKRKQPDFAYLLYGELTALLINYRDFNLEEHGVSVRKDGEDFVLIKRSESDTSYNRYIETPAYAIWKDSYIYEDIAKAGVRSMQFQQLSPITQKVMFKNMTFEGLQLLYLPLLAKLQILEKRYLVGILMKDIELTIKEFEFLTRTIEHSEVKILAADFYSKMGDILFYKNKVFNSSSDNKTKINAKKQTIEISHYPCWYYKKAFIALTVQTSKSSKEQNEFKGMTILNILKYVDEDSKQSKAEYLEKKSGTRYRSVLARVFSNLGDAYFQAIDSQCPSCELKKSEPCWANKENDGFWSNLREFIKNPHDDYKLLDFLNDFTKGSNEQHLTQIELAFFLYALSMKFYGKANQHKHSAFQISKMLNCIKYCLRNNKHSRGIMLFLDVGKEQYKYLEELSNKAIRFLYIAYDNLNVMEINKRKEDFDKFNESFSSRDISLQYIQVDSEVSRIRTTVKEIELELVRNSKISEKAEAVKKLYSQFITSPYHSNYSVSARVHRLRVKDRLNREAYKILIQEMQNFAYVQQRIINRNYYSCNDAIDCVYSDSFIKCEDTGYYQNIYMQIIAIITTKKVWKGSITEQIFSNIEFSEITTKKAWKGGNAGQDFNNAEFSEDYINKFFLVLELLIADSIFCLDEILRLIKTAGDSYLFNHSFFASIYYRLANWTAIFDALQNIRSYYCREDILVGWETPPKMQDAIASFPFVNYNHNKEFKRAFNASQINNFLQKQIGTDFKEKLSSHYYREQARVHYLQMVDTHSNGRAYMNLLEQMYFIKGDYDDITSHFNVALERFLINNTDKFKARKKELEEKGKRSTIYLVNNYFERI